MEIRAAVLAGILFFVVSNVYGQASRVAEWKGPQGTSDSLRIFSEPCSDAATLKEMVARIPPEYHAKFQKSVLYFEGQKYEGCWIDLGGEILNLDEKGDFLQPIGLQHFKDKSI